MAQSPTQARSPEGKHSTRTAKVIEIVGTSTSSFEDAINNAIADARDTTRNITGAQVKNMSISCNDGEIAEYKADLKLAFGIERTQT